MLIKKKVGNLAGLTDKGRAIDRLPLEWHECSKRILHKKTGGGREVVLKLLNEPRPLQQDDVLYADDNFMIVVEIMACDAISIKPSSMYEMAFVSYEIGNKHLPLFYEEDFLLLPYDAPTFRLLQASGMKLEVGKRKLTKQIRTTVQSHTHGGESLFSKILKMTSSNE